LNTISLLNENCSKEKQLTPPSHVHTTMERKKGTNNQKINNDERKRAALPTTVDYGNALISTSFCICNSPLKRPTSSLTCIKYVN